MASSVTTDRDKGLESNVPEDYTWDFVVVLPVPGHEQEQDLEEGEEKLLPALEPSEVHHTVL